MTAAAILGLPMRDLAARPLLVSCLAAACLLSADGFDPGAASAQARPARALRPARPRAALPATTPVQPGDTPDTSPASVPEAPPAAPAATAAEASPSAEQATRDADAAGLATPPPAHDAGPDADMHPRSRGHRPRHALRDGDDANAPDDDERAERERWRIPSDLVNPFRDRPGLAGRHRARDVDAESWFIADEDLLDPWESGAIGPFYSVRCEGRRCRPDSDRPIFLARPRARSLEGLHRPRRRRTLPSIDLAALGSVTTVDDSARARLEAQATVHTGAFGLGLSLTTSTGRTRVDGERLTHTRHAFAAIAQHRLHDGTVALDLGVSAGVMVMSLEETRVAPVARVMATLGVPLVGNASLIFRADALTTFVRPAERATAEGPSAFEFGMGVGLRIATR